MAGMLAWTGDVFQGQDIERVIEAVTQKFWCYRHIGEQCGRPPPGFLQI